MASLGARARIAAAAGVGGARVARAKAPPGQVLVQTLGCGACHADLPPPAMPARAFGAGADIGPDSVFDALLRGAFASPDGRRMPGFHLDSAEAAALALYLGRGEPARRLRRLRDDNTNVSAETGGWMFRALGCAGCHAHPDHRPEPAGPALAAEGSRVQPAWLRAYLARPHRVRPFGPRPGSGARMPDFALDEAKADSLAAFLLRRTIDLPPFEPETLSRFARHQIDTLLAARWSCLGCHAWQGRGGRIGPDLGGAAARLRPEYIRALLADPAAIAPATMLPDPSLPPRTLDRIASRLAAGPADGPAAYADSLRAGYPSLLTLASADAPPATASGSGAGAATYASKCAPCHGASGLGDGFNAGFLRVRPANHTDSATLAARADATLYDITVAGGFAFARSPEMPAFTDLPPETVHQLVAHLRTLCRCTAPAWSRDGRAP